MATAYSSQRNKIRALELAEQHPDAPMITKQYTVKVLDGYKKVTLGIFSFNKRKYKEMTREVTGIDTDNYEFILERSTDRFEETVGWRKRDEQV